MRAQPPPFDHASTALAAPGLLRLLFRTWRFGVELQRLERGKRMIQGVGSHDQRLENCIRPARIGINSQEQRIGCKPAKIDDAIDDWFRRIWNLAVAFGGLIDQIRQFRNLLRWREDQIDRLVDLVLDRIERYHTGLSDPRPHSAGNMDAASTLRRHIQRGLRRQHFAQARDSGHGVARGGVGFDVAVQSGIRYLHHNDGNAPGICCFHHANSV